MICLTCFRIVSDDLRLTWTCTEWLETWEIQLALSLVTSFSALYLPGSTDEAWAYVGCVPLSQFLVPKFYSKRAINVDIKVAGYDFKAVPYTDPAPPCLCFFATRLFHTNGLVCPLALECVWEWGRISGVLLSCSCLSTARAVSWQHSSLVHDMYAILVAPLLLAQCKVAGVSLVG